MQKKFNIKQVAIIFFTGIVGSAATTVLTLVSLANNDHFTIIANSGRIEALEGLVVPRNEFVRFESDLIQRLDGFETRFDKTDAKLDSMQEIIINHLGN